MSTSSEVSSGGIGLGGAIFIVFLVLKLLDINPVATWSWWWVTSPLWIPIVLVLGIMAIIGIFALIVTGIAALFGR